MEDKYFTLYTSAIESITEIKNILRLENIVFSSFIFDFCPDEVDYSYCLDVLRVIKDLNDRSLSICSAEIDKY